MANDLINCPNCGMRQSNLRDKCKACGVSFVAVPASGGKAIAPAAAIMLSTIDCVPGFVIESYLGPVSFMASNSGWSAATKGNNALRRAWQGLMTNASSLGANAVVGVNSSTFGAGGGITSIFGGDAVGVLLFGTAVVVRPE